MTRVQKVLVVGLTAMLLAACGSRDEGKSSPTSSTSTTAPKSHSSTTTSTSTTSTTMAEETPDSTPVALVGGSFAAFRATCVGDADGKMFDDIVVQMSRPPTADEGPNEFDPELRALFATDSYASNIMRQVVGTSAEDSCLHVFTAYLPVLPTGGNGNGSGQGHAGTPTGTPPTATTIAPAAPTTSIAPASPTAPTIVPVPASTTPPTVTPTTAPPTTAPPQTAPPAPTTTAIYTCDLAGNCTGG